MRISVPFVLLTLLCAMPAAVAAEEAKTKRQQLMADCNRMAGDKGLKGEDRKRFMSECLKGNLPVAAAAPDKMTQQGRMASCNKEASARNLKGDERKKFMSQCLKG